MLEIIALILVSEVLGIAGQILYKKKLNKIDDEKYSVFLKTVLSSPMIWLGFFSIAAGIIIWLIALAKTELNIAYSLDSLQYIITPFAAWFFLAEKIDKNKIIGTLFVFGGIILVAVSA